MKILQIVSQNTFPANDGGKLSVSGITKFLSGYGHEVHYFAYANKNNIKSSKLISKYAVPHLVLVDTGNTIMGAILSVFSKLPYNMWKYRTSRMKKELTLFLRENKIDIVQVEQVHMGWVVDIARKYTDAPIVLRPQNVETTIMERFYKNQKNILIKIFSYLQFQKLRRYEPKLCEKFDVCVMISPIDEQRIRSMNPKINATSVPAGIDERLLKYENEDPDPYSLVHIGHTDWYPNYDGLNWFLNKIYPMILARDSNYMLYIYGGGSTTKFPIPHELKNNVKIMGFADDLWGDLVGKSIGIVPLRIGGGIRIKIIEMLAFGINIVSTSIGAEGIGVKNGKQISIADTEKEFCEAILNYKDDVAKYKIQKENGRNFIRDNYTWEKIGRRFQEIYNNLLKVNTDER